jgi:hypothetical protein
VNESEVVLGSELLQAPPPPVQAPAGNVTTLVAELVLTVIVPVQDVPSVAPLQVYFSAPEEIVGPPLGVKSEDALTVILPLPVDVVRAR